ncbi:VWA 2 domain containing protein [Trichuris trichiura]|uniref:VWA 2 domain containing protein n=1 Tax=Trichuris trichiura TaxID=36087 RepID=A0A077Z8V1_TRITR|nr:VWA 2 domain containing protein [Trichuris trichiura]
MSAEECLSIWTQFVRFTESLSVELCERLRAILVPTTASRLQGDYRTGKRLNIRKLIPFVASNFRQNKIWLRRTKRAKRSYQIIIAIDSSSSMMDNRAKQIAIESLALISNALRRLEVGSVAVCKFGESTELLSPLCDHFDDLTGAAVVQGLNFSELRTNVCNLLKCVPSFFSSPGDGGDFVGIDAPARLLVIVSDGRGVYAEGQDAMKQSIQELIQFGVFILFIIIDQESPGKSSIFDVKVPTFKDNGRLDIVSYLEIFPFPFYIILKRISDLPGVVGDALCQWFQMVANI